MVEVDVVVEVEVAAEAETVWDEPDSPAIHRKSQKRRVVRDNSDDSESESPASAAPCWKCNSDAIAAGDCGEPAAAIIHHQGYQKRQMAPDRLDPLDTEGSDRGVEESNDHIPRRKKRKKAVIEKQMDGILGLGGVGKCGGAQDGGCARTGAVPSPFLPSHTPASPVSTRAGLVPTPASPVPSPLLPPHTPTSPVPSPILPPHTPASPVPRHVVPVPSPLLPPHTPASPATSPKSTVDGKEARVRRLEVAPSPPSKRRAVTAEADAPPFRSPVVSAAYESVCGCCRGAVHRADRITKSPSGDHWWHEKCFIADAQQKRHKTQRRLEFSESPSSSTDHDAVVHFVAHGQGHGIVSAGAGAGKTQAIVWGFEQVADDAVCLAFNKAASVELQTRIAVPAGRRQVAYTFHAAGLGLVQKAWGKATVVKGKTKAILVRMFRGDTPTALSPEGRFFRGFVKWLVSMAKSHGLGCPGFPDIDPAGLHQLVMRYDGMWRLKLPKAKTQRDPEPPTEFGLGSWAVALDRAIRIALEVLQESVAHARPPAVAVDFDDMVYIPVRCPELFRRRHAFVFCDESQDLNPVRTRFLQLLTRPGGRILAVGDPSQAIYGFTGGHVRGNAGAGGPAGACQRHLLGPPGVLPLPEVARAAGE